MLLINSISNNRDHESSCAEPHVVSGHTQESADLQTESHLSQERLRVAKEEVRRPQDEVPSDPRKADRGANYFTKAKKSLGHNSQDAFMYIAKSQWAAGDFG
jgi:hypothetical protein